ncbi:sugar phosphate isomerase/epimerase family protein [Neorhodopirellula pilleata]|uniref:Xylose isomerase-like TIM barrel n=1 Tax=Neorhodopirellula pilleata TaxID=2714738 RepID=A0A5C6A9R8_9BACT|nr:sugar phosphate isomerase/epimerase family protein [Neorhodopirellula pilleata]TWT95073.1 Xylose isomerase-like TIM barrel [Neorhodopirellula pilleata]
MAELKIAVRLDSIHGVRANAVSLRKALTLVASMGASGVELCGRRLIDVSELSDTGVRTLRKILDDLNLQIVSIRFPTRHGFDRIEDLDRRVDATKMAMRTAYRLGAPLVVNQIGPVPRPPQRKESSASSPRISGSMISGQMPPEGLSVEQAAAWAASIQSGGRTPSGASPKNDEPVDPRWNTMRAVLEDLGRYGAKVGAFFAAETGTEPGEYLAELVDTSAESYVAVALNPGQLIINRFSVPAAVRALGDRIRIVNAVDGVLDLSAGRGIAVPVGQGTADFPSLIGQLEDIPYRGPFVVGRADMPEDNAIGELAQSVQYLKSL